MLCIHSQNNDPYFNLAAEEFLLRNGDEEVFMMWQSTPAIVTGKHQNVLAEINYRYTREHHIDVARRLTGGGTVYHDPGNINFSFIRYGEPGKLVNFGAFIEPVIGFLKSAGVVAYQGPKHEILVNGRKISGNAEHVYKNRVLHHGTLLFDAHMDRLRQTIAHSGGVYTDKAVQSNRSNVINLVECIHPVMSLEAFKESFFSFITNWFGGKRYEPDEKQTSAIRQLAGEKFSKWEWIFGWSPDYEFVNSYQNPSFKLNIQLAVHRGKITHCRIASRSMDEAITGRISTGLTGGEHRESHIRQILEQSGAGSLLTMAEFEDLVFAFF